MKAALYEGKGAIRMTTLPTPVCGENDVLIRNICSSICGTDVAVYMHGPGTGHRITVGDEFGHETVSRVAEVGKNVTAFAVGQRVYPYPRQARGDAKRAGTLGAFSEYILCPNARPAQELYFVPDEISDRTACLIEPFTVGCRAARRSNPKSGENAIVFGAGTIGLAAAIALKWFGCNGVMVCDLSDFRLEKAKALGFSVCNSGREDVKQKAAGLFGAAPSLSGSTANADIYIDAAGAPNLIELYQSIGKIESRLVVVAVLAGLRPVDVLGMTFSQQAIIGSGGYLPEDVQEVLSIMASGRWDIESLITHAFPWEQLPQAIEQASNAAKALNVIIEY